MEPINLSSNAFTANGGEIRLWIEQGAIHMIAGDARHADPAELTEGMARKLAQALVRMADRIEADDASEIPLASSAQ